MLDIKFIRENPDLIKEAARKKHIAFNLDDLLATDARRIALLAIVEAKRAQQNSVSDQVASASDPEVRQALIAEMKLHKDEVAKEEAELKGVMDTWRKQMLEVPNIPDFSVPEGESDADNQETKVWGEPTVFEFTPKSHHELMLAKDMVDFDRGTKVAGFRGYFLKGDGALLSYAIWQYVMDRFVAKGDYTPMLVPSLVRKEVFLGTGYLPQGEEDLYRTQDDMYLAGTAEVATMGYYMDETIDLSRGPIKFISFSPCFRREAGSHGKDTKGLIRVHEFYKWEQVILCEANHQTSVALHEELRRNSEELMEGLGIPYHVVVNCGGDLGQGQVKKYDIEAWIPSEGKYRETHSASYFHDFQTRRLNIRYRDGEGKLRFAHSLNNTAIATPRVLTAVIENYQNSDGTIRVPEALKKYIGKEVLGLP